MTSQTKEPGSAEPITREAAFWKEMEGRHYGEEERRDAQGWFNTGWEAARVAHQAPQAAPAAAEQGEPWNPRLHGTGPFSADLDVSPQPSPPQAEEK